MKVVGPTTSDYAYYAAEHTSVFSLVIMRLHLELLYRVYDGRNHVRAARHLGVNRAVQQVQVGAIELALYGGLRDLGRRHTEHGQIVKAYILALRRADRRRTRCQRQ